MRKVFEIEAASADGCTQLTLPAGPYALLDALERLRLEPGETPEAGALRETEEDTYSSTWIRTTAPCPS